MSSAHNICLCIFRNVETVRMMSLIVRFVVAGRQASSTAAVRGFSSGRHLPQRPHAAWPAAAGGRRTAQPAAASATLRLHCGRCGGAIGCPCVCASSHSAHICRGSPPPPPPPPVLSSQLFTATLQHFSNVSLEACCFLTAYRTPVHHLGRIRKCASDQDHNSVLPRGCQSRCRTRDPQCSKHCSSGIDKMPT